MTEFGAVEGFEWDEGNARKNEKHGVSQRETEQVFLNQPLLVVQDVKLSSGEERYHALGQTDDGRLVHITFTWRASGTKIRVISARPMHWKEKIVYGQGSETDS